MWVLFYYKWWSLHCWLCLEFYQIVKGSALDIEASNLGLHFISFPHCDLRQINILLCPCFLSYGKWTLKNIFLILKLYSKEKNSSLTVYMKKHILLKKWEAWKEGITKIYCTLAQWIFWYQLISSISQKTSGFFIVFSSNLNRTRKVSWKFRVEKIWPV